MCLCLLNPRRGVLASSQFLLLTVLSSLSSLRRSSMEILNSAVSNGPFNISSFSSKFSWKISNKRNHHRFYVPVSKLRYNRVSPFYSASTLKVSARLGANSRRRNSLRKKLIGERNLRLDTSTSDPGTRPRNPNFDGGVERDDDLVEITNSEALKEMVPEGSNLLNELENWITQCKKEAEYWGIGSNPIFTVYHDSIGKVEKVEVDEDEILRRRQSFEDMEAMNVKITYAKKLAEQMEREENVISRDSSIAKFVSSKHESQFISSIQNRILRLDLVPKLPMIGKAVFCGFVVLWVMKMALTNGNKEEVELTELEKEMMRRKMKSWKEKETLEKGAVEVLQEEDTVEAEVSFEKPKLNHQELMNSISKVKDSIPTSNLLNSSRSEVTESINDNDEDDDDADDDDDEVLEEENTVEAKVSCERPKLDHEELMNSISEINDSITTSNLLNSSQNEVSESIESDNKIDDDNDDDDDDDEKDSRLPSVPGHKPRVIRSVKEAKELLSKQGMDEGEALYDQNPIDSSLRESIRSFSDNEHREMERYATRENWMEKNFDQFEPMIKKMREGFRDNYMEARERKSEKPGTIAEIMEIYPQEDEDELEWMNDETLRDIVFRVRDNELAGRDPFHSMNDGDKAMFFQGLEKKVEKVNGKLSHLHQWLHSNIENLDYGIDGISVYDPPEKIIPRWKKNPEFQRSASVSAKKEERSSPEDKNTSKAKIVIEGSDGSARAGKKAGKEFWEHTKKWSRGFVEVYNAENDPEVKAALRDMGKGLDRWITEEEVKDAADLMEKLPERNKKFMEKKLEKLKREMELFGPQAVVSKYREYGEEKEEDYLWWLDLPHVLCLELYEVNNEEKQVGFYALEMASDLELEPKPHHVIAFEDAADCKNLCYIIQAHLGMLGKGNVFIVPQPPKDAFREAKANGFGVTVIRKGELKINVDQTLEEVEEEICEIGSKMYHDMMMRDRSVDISQLMKGVFGLKSKSAGGRRRRKLKMLKNSKKKSS